MVQPRDHDGWLKLLFAPLFSALITGGLMYVAVRTELATVTARQELLHQDLQMLRQEFIAYRTDRFAAWEQTRERLGSIETRLKALEEASHR